MSQARRIIFHIDVNSAYLSWEAVYRIQHGDPVDLRDIPSVVGGDPATRHGIVLAKSIPAKKYKIQTGEGLFSARMKCPGLVVVPPRYELYMQCSRAMLELLREYSSCIQRYSIDELFMDYTGMERHFGPPVEAAYSIKDRIRRELGFTVNIGISSNKLLAKMASELEKPDKVHTLFPEEIPEKMWPLPVGELFMVGRATAPKLYRRGIYTIGDLANTDPQLLKQWLKSYGLLIWSYANGYDQSPIRDNGYPMKGLGNSTTIPFDVEDRETACMVLLSLVETVAMRLRDANRCAQVISVSIKNSSFEWYSHQRKIPVPTDVTNIIYRHARELLDEMWRGEPIRHMGVRLSELCSSDFYQLSLFEGDRERDRRLDRAVDGIRMKYGARSVIRSSFLHTGLNPITGGVLEQEDYPMMSSIL